MNATSTPLRCLIVEDAADDALLMLRQLRAGGCDVSSERVDTPEAMRAALGRQPWDVVLSDYRMPHFSGLAALEILKASGLDLPFIMVSGTIGEETAVAAMKAGVDDYLIKGELAHLTVAVERELRNAAMRRERKVAEAALQESEAKFRTFFEHSNVGKCITSPSGELLEVNQAISSMLGYSLAEFSHQTWQAVTHPDDVELTQREITALVSGQQDSIRFEKRYLHKNGSVVWGDLSSALRRDAAGQPLYMMTSVVNITERKQAEAARQQQADDLRARNVELTRFNRAAVDRELRMIELKAEVNALCDRLGEAPRHVISRPPAGPGPVTGPESAPAPPSGGGG